MNNRRWVNVTLGTALAAMLLLFQNCAPGFQALDRTTASLGNGADGTPLDPTLIPPVVDVPVDPAQALSVYVRGATANQGDNLNVKLELNKATTTDVVVSFATKSGTAIENVDYKAVTANATIAAGALSTTIVIPTNVTNVNTSDRALTLQITSATGAAIAQKEATEIIKATLKLDKFKTVVAMGDHSCGITSTDTLKCWGSNASGALGLGATSQGGLPLEVVGLAGVKQITGAFGRTCIITATNTVKCAGSNGNGQLGNGTKVDSASFVDVTGLAGVTQISMNQNFVCALLAAGNVKCWGNNRSGGLGDATLAEALIPTDVAGVTGAKAISTSNLGACAVTATDALKCWGTNVGTFGTPANDAVQSATDVPNISGVKQFNLGVNHACAIFAGDIVKCWGVNGGGEFGTGSTPASSLTPVEVTGLGAVKKLVVARDRPMTCAITIADVVKCWGDNNGGVISLAAVPSVAVATTIAGLEGAKDVSIAFLNGCAVTAGDTGKCWGRDQSGSIGNGTVLSSALPTAVAGLSGVTSMSADDFHGCALTTGGVAKCWGGNDSGQLGDGTTTDSKLVPVTVTGLSGLKQISAGSNFTCAITSTDSVKCWGMNSSGQLGNGTTTDSIAPVDVAGLAGVKQIVGEYNFTCALLATGAVKCWGENTSGQLGAGLSQNMSSTPVAVTGLAGIKQIATGYTQACALTATNTVKCWGSNDYGELGNGTTVGSSVPVDVTGLTGVVSIGAGQTSTCAVLATGTAKCWGDNSNGKLGNKTLVSSSVPVDVTGLTGVKKIAMDFRQTCAVVDAELVRCWGVNYRSILGSNFASTVTAPSAGVFVRGVRDLISTSNLNYTIDVDGVVRRFGLIRTDSTLPLDVTTPVL